jgi:hypothetical protein
MKTFLSLLIFTFASLPAFCQTKPEVVAWLNLKLEENRDFPYEPEGFVVDPYTLSVNQVNGVEIININHNFSGQVLTSYSLSPNSVLNIVTDKTPSGNTNLKVVCSANKIMKREYSLTGNGEVVSENQIDTLIILLGGPESEIDLMKDQLNYLVGTMGKELVDSPIRD